MGDELAHEVRQRRPRPGNPAVRFEEAPLPFAGKQRLAVVELEDELDLVPERLDRVEQAEAGAAEPCGHAGSPEEIGKRLRQLSRHLFGEPERHPEPRVDRAPERDQRFQPRVAPIGGRLVAEHPALRVAGEVHVPARRLRDAVDRVGDRQHVVGERSLEPSLLLIGSTEVDHPRINAVLVQDRHAARTRGDVVHLRGEHHRRHQHHRGAGGAFASRVVVPELVDAMLQGDGVGRGLLARVEATEARNLERILRGCPEASDRPGDRFRQQRHRPPTSSPNRVAIVASL